MSIMWDGGEYDPCRRVGSGLRKSRARERRTAFARMSAAIIIGWAALIAMAYGIANLVEVLR